MPLIRCNSATIQLRDGNKKSGLSVDDSVQEAFDAATLDHVEVTFPSSHRDTREISVEVFARSLDDEVRAATEPIWIECEPL